VSLLLAPGKPVPHEILVDRLWGEEPPAKAPEDLRVYVSRLNRQLRRVADDGTHLVAQSHGYALVTDPQSVDLHQFRLWGRQADAMALSGDDEQAISLLRAGDALWRGQALAGLPASAWVSRMRATLEEEHHVSIIKRIDLELRLGHHTELIGELRQLTDEHPMDETLIGQQMTALYRSGRQADALIAYRKAYDRLADQGIEPDPALAELHQAILRHDPNLAITPVFRRPGLASQPNTLPPATDDFIGRSDEIRQIAQQSEHENKPFIQVIEGMPGVGKTALAVHVAHRMSGRYPDAQLFIDFCGHHPQDVPLSTADALYRLLRMLEVPAARIPGDVRERANLWHAELTHRRVLIVLDDVRDLEDVQPILPDAGDSLSIVTSRRRYRHRPGIRNWTLDVLPVHDAITLFTLVSGRQAENSDEMTRAVRLCGCLPLAIRMSASWLRHGKPSGLAELLDDLSNWIGEHDLTGQLGQHIAPVFEVSYRGLTRNQRQLFRYLGVSPCQETGIHTAMALTGRGLAATQKALRALLDRHLLTESSAGRFRFHDLIHAYAASRSAREDSESDRRDAIGRLLHYYSESARKADQTIFARDDQEAASSTNRYCVLPPMGTPGAARKWLESELHNILMAARHAARQERKRECVDLADALAEFLETGGYWDEAVEAHGLALQACRDLNDRAGAARAAFQLSMADLLTGQHEAALHHANDATALFRKLGDRCGEAAALDRIGTVCHKSAQFRDSLAHHEESSDIYRATGDLHGVALTLCHIGTAYSSLGRYTEAANTLNQALALYRQIGDRRGEAKVLNNIGAVQDDQGYHRDAIQNYQESLRIFQEIDGRPNIAMLEHNMGRVYQYKGDYENALPTYRKALATYRSIGDLRCQAYVLCDIGSTYHCKGYNDEALAHHEKARSIAEEIGERYACVKALCGIAEAQQGSGRHSAALDVFQKALSLAREIESPVLEARALQGMGDTLLHIGRAESARIYLRQALDICRQMGVPEATTLEIRLETLSASA
jgi:DNA-binding SARP family transcriptional activator/tetratricopeptide (TPR) repeat protein